MKRLTEWTGEEWIPVQERQNGKIIGHKDCMRRLAAYENTGLEPEEVDKLKEKQLPMKIEEVHVDEYYCPACGAEHCCNDGTVEDDFCPKCGQALCQQTGI